MLKLKPRVYIYYRFMDVNRLSLDIYVYQFCETFFAVQFCFFYFDAVVACAHCAVLLDDRSSSEWVSASVCARASRAYIVSNTWRVFSIHFFSHGVYCVLSHECTHTRTHKLFDTRHYIWITWHRKYINIYDVNVRTVHRRNIASNPATQQQQQWQVVRTFVHSSHPSIPARRRRCSYDNNSGKIKSKKNHRFCGIAREIIQSLRN